jgi:GT2 family glycosyltransferase/glycosyltransferase involved in cell wall biosynthesis
MGSEHTPGVVTVVVTYNGLDDTIVCVDSLLRTTYPRQQIVVVDNGTSGEADAVNARFGAVVTTIRAGRNLGFGAGANLGMRWALDHDADYVWVLNNDTVVPPETIGRLVSTLDADPGIGIVSPQITAPEGPEAPGGIWFAGGVVDLGRGETRHLVTPIAPGNGAVPSAFLTGCALMIRSDTLRRVGLFWERLFLYWEDTDLDLRVQRSGWRTCVVADAWIHHSIHGSTADGVVAYYHFRNAVLVTWRHARRRVLAEAIAHLSYLVARRWAGSALRRRPAPLPETRGLAAGIATVSRWAFRAPGDARLAPLPVSADGKPLAVLHVVRRYAPMLGGTETYVRDLAEAQARHGHRVTVLTLDHDVTGVEPGHLPPREKRAGVRVMRLSGLGARRFAITSRPWRLVREVARADVVHLHDIRFMAGTTCLAARLGGHRAILHTHGLIFHTQWAARLKRFLMRAYFGPLLRLTGTAIVASSESDRDSLLTLVPYLTPQLVLVENAIQLDRLLSLPRHPVRGRILAFGRVSQSKGLDRLLEAVSTVKEPNWELRIAGAEEPAERTRLEQIAVQLGIGERVRFLGAYSDEEFGGLLSSADLAAFPSSGEGFGLALLEAMAAGVPVVANDIPAHRALLGPDLAGCLVEFGSPTRAGPEIARMLRTAPRTKLKLGEDERSRAGAYDEPRLVHDLEVLYESLGLRSRPRRA